MHCSTCGQREATIHEVVIDAHGNKVEKHLCEQCAAMAGVGEHPMAPMAHVAGAIEVAGEPGAGGVTGAAQSCPGCGVTFAEFRQSGLLGCPSCYAAFESRLVPLLARAHEGGSHHVGKTPKRVVQARGAEAGDDPFGDVAALTERVGLLRRQLDEAVKSEKYERAAELKGEIERVLRLGARAEPRPGEGAS